MSDVPTIPARPVLEGETDRYVSLREFEQRLFSLQQQNSELNRAQKELLEVRSEALDKALELQAREYERRLTELNHAHANAIQNWRQSLPREVFENTLMEWSKWRDAVNTQLTTLAELPSRKAALSVRVEKVENQLQLAQGALTLIRFMGFAGVIALLMTLLKLAGWVS